MQYSVYGISYESACSLISDLKKQNIEANITIGGISIIIDDIIELDFMNKICKKYNTKAAVGVTRFEEDIMFFNKKGD